MEDDPFETVAIAYSQPQALVILSLFGWCDILAYAANLEMARINCPITLALGGIPIRVVREDAAEARALLAEAADQSDESLREELGERIAKVLFCGITGMTPPPKVSASIIG